MDAKSFFDTVTRPNITAFIQNDEDYRLAVNAALSLDSAYGIIFEELREKNHSFLGKLDCKQRELKDNHFKDHVAALCREFEILRDVAYSLKHGKLSARRARMVYSAQDVSSEALVCGLLSCGDRLGATSVFISLAGGELERAWPLFRRAELFTDELLGDLGLGPLACPVPEYHASAPLHVSSQPDVC
ncbi:hypothetical protein ATCR1_04604 [Agrobacterium tumefaciens CCNWGS0286]|uniref:hypothetical protein n=1 Tax=Agrobacterium tumefaciens TaxID=358 RepID=UPI0002331773|nr:hypothetical protein [Agrobacterium tumefaciens]EHH08189.1 hypothetical protein ATCR1_04604 [Agrobacterium tumefaciens CCNWGS0286]